jgi:hypothetical protein
LRALRVVLACLVLWLPARAASASFAPADVVMIAGARGAASAGGVGGAIAARSARAQNARGARVGLGTGSAHFFASSTRPARTPPNINVHRARETRTVRRTVAPPLFLKHCALLR